MLDYVFTYTYVSTLIGNGNMHRVTIGVGPYPDLVCMGLEDTKPTPAKDVEVHA